MNTLQSLRAEVIKDSRGQNTIKVIAQLADGSRGAAMVPQGKSTGSFEARYISPSQAVKSVEDTIALVLCGQDVADQISLDSILKELDGTPQKERLGANAVLGTSIACAKAAAKSQGIELWEYWRRFYKGILSIKKPKLYMNLINGGLHAKNNLSFQEYLLVPNGRTIKESFNLGSIFYQELERVVEEKYDSKNVGDEGGFAPQMPDDKEPFLLFGQTAQAINMQGEFSYGIDAAASNVDKSKEELMDFYLQMADEFPLIYIEDPFAEDDFEYFAQLCSRLKEEVSVVGDDLTVTSVERMNRAAQNKSVNGVIIKPNQAGTITEALAAVEFARQLGWLVVVSHRSGETEDDFIADFAWAVGADGVKFGAPGPKERLVKYQRLIEIENTAET